MKNWSLPEKLYWLAAAYALISFLSTRGPDGALLFGVCWFAAIGMIYVSLVLVTCRRLSWHLVGHTLAFLAATTASFLFRPQLDEMGGMLYLILPAIVLASGVLAAAFLFVRSFVGRRSQVAP